MGCTVGLYCQVPAPLVKLNALLVLVQQQGFPTVDVVVQQLLGPPFGSLHPALSCHQPLMLCLESLQRLRDLPLFYCLLDAVDNLCDLVVETLPLFGQPHYSLRLWGPELTLDGLLDLYILLDGFLLCLGVV